MVLILNLQTGSFYLKFHIHFDVFLETVRLSSDNPSTLSECQLISGINSGKVASILTSEGERINPDPFIPTREETGEEDQDSR